MCIYRWFVHWYIWRRGKAGLSAGIPAGKIRVECRRVNKQNGEMLLRMSPRVGYNSMAQCEPSITLNTMTALLKLIFTSLQAAVKLVNESTPTIITYSAMQSVSNFIQEAVDTGQSETQNSRCLASESQRSIMLMYSRHSLTSSGRDR